LGFFLANGLKEFKGSIPKLLLFSRLVFECEQAFVPTLMLSSLLLEAPWQELDPTWAIGSMLGFGSTLKNNLNLKCFGT
jgi:hypothetical protein